jgi:hypothetical protein
VIHSFEIIPKAGTSTGDGKIVRGLGGKECYFYTVSLEVDLFE